jgi:hypothetical protein
MAAEVASVPVLPLIDLLILLSTGSLVVGFVLKAIALTTQYRPTVLGFSSLDFVIVTGLGFAFALVLAARSWVKLNEQQLMSVRSARRRSRVVVSDYDEDDYEFSEQPADSTAASAEIRS